MNLFGRAPGTSSGLLQKFRNLRHGAFCLTKEGQARAQQYLEKRYYPTPAPTAPCAPVQTKVLPNSPTSGPSTLWGQESGEALGRNSWTLLSVRPQRSVGSAIHQHEGSTEESNLTIAGLPVHVQIPDMPGLDGRKGAGPRGHLSFFISGCDPESCPAGRPDVVLAVLLRAPDDEWREEVPHWSNVNWNDRETAAFRQAERADRGPFPSQGPFMAV